MKNIAFSIWAVGFPIAMAISNHGVDVSETLRGIAAIIEIAIWGFVGFKLYEK